jgi:T4 RnlA family RNA ligase
MSPFAHKLFNELSALVASENDAFYKRDYERDGRHYRVFAYRLASYTEFLLPSAIECRGTMFEITDPAYEPVGMKRLVSLPMEKFWNLHENPATMNLDLSTIISVETKADGSLISTYLHINSINGNNDAPLGVKSKTSIDSDQVHAVYAFLKLPENAKFAQELHRLAERNYTVNMEWCAPENRIVLAYQESSLTVLNIRDNLTGLYIPKQSEELLEFNEVKNRWIESIPFENPVQFIKSINQMTDVEGFVALLSSGQRVKIKTDWYAALHKTKDSVNSDRRLYEVVLAEGADDLRAMFFNDPWVLNRITWMQEYVAEKYNALSKQVETFYDANKGLARKDFAILGQKLLDRHAFKLCMERYVGREVSVKDYMAAKWKEFGIKDDPEPSTDDVQVAVNE